MDQRERIEKAGIALAVLYDQAPPDQYISLSTWDLPSAPTEKPAPQTWGFLPKDFQEFLEYGVVRGDNSTWNVHMRVTTTATRYWGPGPRGKEKESTGIGCLMVDIDPSSTRTAEDIEESVAAFAQQTGLHPTLGLNSGHGRQYGFKLKQWLELNTAEDIVRVKRKALWLHQQLGGDSTHDLSHPFRFPYSYNRKGAEPILTGVVAYQPACTYELDDFGDADLIADSPNSEDETQDAVIPADLLARLKRTNRELWARIYSREEAEAYGVTERSNNEQWIANCLAGLNYSDGLIRSVLTKPDWNSGAKFQETQDWSYIHRTVRAARTWVTQVSPLRFMSRGGFKPMLVVRELIKKHRLLRYGPDTSVYQGGVYTPSEHSQQLRELVQKLLGDESQPEYINSVIDSCRDCAEIPKWPGIDPKRYVNLLNGLYDLEQECVVPHDATVYSTLQFPITYEPGKVRNTDAIEKFVGEVLSADVLPMFWEYVGLCLWYGKATKHFLFIQGESNSGKNSLMKFLVKMVGPRATVLPLDYIAHSPWAFGDLLGSPVNLCDEMMDFSILENAKIKRLWNGQETPIPAERKHQKMFSYVFTGKGVFFCNDLPDIQRSEDTGTHNRYEILRCRQVFEESAVGERYVNDLLNNHFDEFVHMAMQGLKRFRAQDNTFTITESMLADKASYQLASNSLTAWIEDDCYLQGPRDVEIYSTSAQLCSAYNEWDKRHGGRAQCNLIVWGRKFKAIKDRYGITRAERYVDGGPRSVHLGIAPKERIVRDEKGTYRIRY